MLGSDGATTRPTSSCAMSWGTPIAQKGQGKVLQPEAPAEVADDPLAITAKWADRSGTVGHVFGTRGRREMRSPGPSDLRHPEPQYYGGATKS